MKELYSRRDMLRLTLGLSGLALSGCGGGGGGGADPGPDPDPPPPGDPPALSGYKALVCVFLLGGNDAYNMIVPATPELHTRYSRARLNLALSRDSLLPLHGLAGDGASYGLNPNCSELQRLFNRGSAAIVGNVGSLLHPTTRADYLTGTDLPPRLFSHNDQVDQWHTARPDVLSATGWAGRTADILQSVNSGGVLPMNVSIAGNNLLQAALREQTFSVPSSGPTALSIGADNTLRRAYDAILAQERSDPYEREFALGHRRALDISAALQEVLDAAPALTTAFPEGNGLAERLQMVARLIQSRAALGMKRQIFYVALGGWDTHDQQLTQHPALLRQLSQALAAFQQAMSDLGVADEVTTFTASDFGRSLTVNGKGTDHGWSSHHWVLGGAVRGARYWGSMPSLRPDGADDSRGGRFIPSVAVDEYAATLLRWFGAGDGALDDIFPNLRRFATRGLGFLG